MIPSHNYTPSNAFQHKDSNKVKKAPSQLQTIFNYLKEHTATASMVADATGVPQKNICRYKADLQKANKLWEIEKKRCKKTGFKAWYLSTNPENSIDNQLKLFSDAE